MKLLHTWTYLIIKCLILTSYKIKNSFLKIMILFIDTKIIELHLLLVTGASLGDASPTASVRDQDGSLIAHKGYPLSFSNEPLYRLSQAEQKDETMFRIPASKILRRTIPWFSSGSFVQDYVWVLRFLTSMQTASIALSLKPASK